MKNDSLIMFLIFFVLNLFDSYSINTSTSAIDYLSWVIRWIMTKNFPSE